MLTQYGLSSRKRPTRLGILRGSLLKVRLYNLTFCMILVIAPRKAEDCMLKKRSKLIFNNTDNLKKCFYLITNSMNSPDCTIND